MSPPKTAAVPTPPRRILRRVEVTRRTGLSGTTIYREIQAGRFPKSVSLGRRAVGWFEHEVDAWLEARAGRRDA
jgi:prophage regulatory protein